MANTRKTSVTSNDAEDGCFSSCQACGRSTLITQMTAGEQHEQTKKRFTTSEESTPLCQACKKFYSRYRGKFNEEKCSCGNRKNTDEICRFCRYRRCEAVIIGVPENEVTQPPVEEKLDFSRLPCIVCGVSSSGFHFGVVSCEGCKSFFRRSMKKDYKIEYACKAVKEGLNTASEQWLCPTSSNCRKCRLQRCINAGMSLQEVTIGRLTLRRRAAVDAAIKRHSNEGSCLKEKVFRRNREMTEQDDQSTFQMDTVSSNSSSVQLMGRSTNEASPITAGEPVIEQCPSESANNCNTEKVVNSDVPSSSEKSALTVSTDNISPAPEKPKNGLPSSDTTTALMRPRNVVMAIVLGFDEHSDLSSLYDCLKQSSDWFIERAIEAATRLNPISQMQISLYPGVTDAEYLAARIVSHDTYMKYISDFVTALPGTNRIALGDRIVLFTLTYFPILCAQLSLNFDVERQLPNHLCLVRDSPAWNVSATKTPTLHLAIENYLIDAGNRFASTITNMKEFALLCALLVFNPDTLNLENAEAVRSVRHHYYLALVHHLSAGAHTEKRLADIYSLLPFFRQATSILQLILIEAGTNPIAVNAVFSPLFGQLALQYRRLASPNDISRPCDPNDEGYAEFPFNYNDNAL